MVDTQSLRPRPRPLVNDGPVASKRQTRSSATTCASLNMEHEIESPSPACCALSVASPLNAFDEPARREVHLLNYGSHGSLRRFEHATAPTAPLACEANLMDPAFTRALGHVSQYAPPRNRAYDRMIERLLLPELNEDVDQAFIEYEIIPRIVICSTSGLVHSAFGIEPTQFSGQAQEALAQVGRSALRAMFDVDCRRPIEQRMADWVLPLAQFASGARGRQPHLTLAHAKRCARLSNLCHPGRPDLIEHHHFLTCCNGLTSAKGGSIARATLVPLAFGACDSEDDSRETPYPLVDVVLDLARDVLTQPARMYAPGFAIHDDDTAYLVVLDNEGCRIAIISDRWGEGFGELASVLSVLLGLDVYSAGLSPLFRYACDLETGIAPVALCTRYLRPSELEVDAPLVGRTVEFIAEEPVRLVDSTVANGSSVFGRSTVTLQLTRPSLVTCSPAVSTDYLEPSFVVKIQLTTQNFVGHEADVLNKIVERCAAEAPSASAQLIERHVALPEKAKSLGRHRSQMEDSALPILLDSENSEQRLRDSPRHTLDVVVMRNPTPLPAPLDDARAQQRTLFQFCQVFDQLLTLLPALFDLGIHHRDLSIGNILQYQGHLVLVDWETGIVAQPGEQVPVATEDAGSIRFTRATVSWEVRSWLLLGAQFSRLPSHALHHDFESAVYWFLFVLDEFVGNCFSADLWIDLDLRPRGRGRRRRPVFPMDLARTELWGNGEYPNLHKLFLKDFEKLGPEMHGFVERMMCTLPFDLGTRGASEAEVAVANKQKMAAVQAELPEILEVSLTRFRRQSPDAGLCNGTRGTRLILIVSHARSRVIQAVILIGDRAGTMLCIPRVRLEASATSSLALAKTINITQGQSLDRDGVALSLHPVFTHGQLYVALSRAMSVDRIKVLLLSRDPADDDDNLQAVDRAAAAPIVTPNPIFRFVLRAMNGE
ncbi:BZ3500_MvSof-1268-A1-R1_Chr3-2g06298 [Microbotryum saponariae]|uniref:BZ3500_MvSof-1268-A1-R1_Chr3-2g06298 protein n=1 Tax=Microbotryum saponariae TaxID=289078 RepID=A0A2X0LEQ7_9BASI|nr:BZ3500_MvSof-1268-A1-R1_Chr3-2g06298 [Microbotryum saponariae]SDA04269.1 BZ3501_MvSof-1269-A2-R1_Chr3-2g05989 [Microbotryum saponariae]